jgi:KaiB domain
MDRILFPRPARRAADRPQVLLRLYVSGRSEYTQSVVANLDSIRRRYDPDDVIVQVHDAADAAEAERVFFTPMLIILDGRDPEGRTVVVGDLRQPDIVTTLLSDRGIASRQ